jgi:hypothetical protein
VTGCELEGLRDPSLIHTGMCLSAGSMSLSAVLQAVVAVAVVELLPMLLVLRGVHWLCEL